MRRINIVKEMMEIIDAYKDGLSMAKIAKEHKVSVHQIKNILVSNDVIIRGPGRPYSCPKCKEIKKIIADYREEKINSLQFIDQVDNVMREE